jgi:hypothetical protein
MHLQVATKLATANRLERLAMQDYGVDHYAKKTHRPEKSLDALRLSHKAEREMRKAKKASAFMPGLSKFHEDYAKDLLDEAKGVLAPSYSSEISIGREALPALENRSLDGVRETLLDPDTIALDASASRLELLADADAVGLGIDASESIGAQNSLEKMLAHQLAASHRQALRLMARIDRVDDNLEKLRLSNACARLMQIFQDGIRLIDKIRKGAHQVVVVKHLQISNAAQTVIAGKIQTRGGKAQGGVCQKN